MTWLECILVFGVLIFLFYKHGMQNTNFWRKRGVKQMETWIPYFGNHYKAVFKMADPIEITKYYYEYFKGER